MSEEEYIGIVGEIFDGYTEFDFFGRKAYLKHFSIRDQRYIHRFYEKYKSIATAKGIPNEKEMLKQLKKDGLWSEDEDLKIASLEKEIESLKETQSNLTLPSQKESFQKDINAKSIELINLKIERKKVVGKTSEDYGSSRSNEEFIRYIIYKDRDLKENMFSEDEFANLDDEEIALLIAQNRTCGERMSEDNIQHSVLRDFFNMYISQTEDIASFYGSPIVHLSVYQLKLALYARVFYNIFQYNQDIPDNIRKDPSAVLRYAESKKSGDKGSSKIKNRDNGATAVFGATKDDLDFVDSGASKINLSDEISKQGGSMNMEQLMNLMG